MITNVATQQVCPGDLSEHNSAGTVDPVTYALAVDALRHPGPADPARVPESVCSQLFMPGVASPQSAAAGLQALAGLPGLFSVGITPLAPALTGIQNVKAEPPLACYVFAACTGTAAPTLRLSYTRHGRRIRVLVQTLEGNQLVPVPGVNVRLGRHHARTGVRGRATLRLRGPQGKLVATRRGCNPASKAVGSDAAV
jgi:hypothetical protein